MTEKMEEVGERCLFQEIDSYEDDSQGFFDLMTHLSFDPSQDYPNSNSVSEQGSHSNNDQRNVSYDELSSDQYRQSVIVKNNNMNSNHPDENSHEKVHRQIPFLTYLGKLSMLATNWCYKKQEIKYDCPKKVNLTENAFLTNQKILIV